MSRVFIPSFFKAASGVLLSFLLIVSVSLCGNLPPVLYLKFFLFFLGSLLSGAVLLRQLPFSTNFSGIAFALTSAFLGLFFYSFLIFVPTLLGYLVFTSLSLGSAYFWWKQREHFSYGFSLPELAALALAFLCSLFFAFGDVYAFATSPTLPVLSVPQDDMYFFVNLVHSLATGTIHSATYEISTPLNYQFIGYMPAAFLHHYAGIPAHLALYAFEFGLVRLLPFVLIVELVKLYDFRSSLGKWYLVLAPLLFTLLQPLHPLYLLRLDTANFVWGGLGYIGPSLNIGYSFSFVVVVIGLLLITGFERSRSLLASALFIILFVLLAGIKMPVFFAWGCLVSSLAFMNVFFNKNYHLLYCTLIAAPLTLLLMYFLYFGEKTGGLLSLRYDYFPGYFNDMFHFSGSLLHLKIIAGVLVLLLIWGSLRFFFLLYATFRSTTSSLRFLCLSSFAALLLCLLVASVFDLKIMDDEGQMIRDVSYDSLQFIRSAFFLVNTLAVLATFFFLQQLPANRQWIGLSGIVLWMGLSAAGLSVNLYITPEQKNTWFTEVTTELQQQPPAGLLAINPALYHNPYSIWLTATHPGMFWTSNGGCLTTTKNYYRRKLYEDLLTTPDHRSLEQMKKEGVTLFIATPEDLETFQALEQQGKLHAVKDSKWLFLTEKK